MCLTCGTTEKDPKQGSPLSASNRRSYGERQGKDVFRSPATRGSKKDSDRVTGPAGEAVQVPAHLALPGSPQAKQLCHLHTQLSMGQSCHRENILSMCTGSLGLGPTLQPCRLWPARLLCQGGGFPRQEYWSVLANTSCHIRLGHYISFCPRRQLP